MYTRMYQQMADALVRLIGWKLCKAEHVHVTLVCVFLFFFLSDYIFHLFLEVFDLVFFFFFFVLKNFVLRTTIWG